MINKITLPEENYNVPDYDEKQSIKINEIVEEANSLGSLMAQIKLEMNPVGTIYESTSSTNPSTFIGGTWERYGNGRVTAGLDTEQTEFNVIGKTGGSKSLQEHSHIGIFAENNTSYKLTTTPGTGSSVVSSTGGAPTGGNFITGKTGTGNSQNLQPYITVYRFRRTA